MQREMEKMIKNLLYIVAAIGAILTMFFGIKEIATKSEMQKDKIFISKNLYFKDNKKIKELLKENNVKLICDLNSDSFFSNDDFFKQSNIRWEELSSLYNLTNCEYFLKKLFFKKKLNRNIYKESTKFLIEDLLNENYSNSNLALQIGENVFLRQFLSIKSSDKNEKFKVLDPYLILDIGGEFFNGEEYREIFNKYISEKIKENDEYNKKHSKEPFLLKEPNYLNEILNNKANIILKK